MGRIKSLMVKKAARQLINEDVFNTEFENNKKALKNTMPSKSVKNKIAGYITRINRVKVAKQAAEAAAAAKLEAKPAVVSAE